jgi:hypothetical protein
MTKFPFDVHILSRDTSVGKREKADKLDSW